MPERISVALVNQPWGYVKPPITKGGSIPILLYEWATRLAPDCDITYYTRGKFRRESRRESNVDFVYVPVALDKLMLRLQARLHLLHDTPDLPFYMHDWCYRQFARGVGTSARRRGIQIVHVHNYTQFVPVIRRRHPRARIVLHMHCEWASQMNRQVGHSRLAQCDMILGCSEYITRRIQTAFPDLAGRCRTFYNGVFVDRFHPGDRAARTGVQRIVYVGRISPEKGVHTLVEAFAILASKYSSLQLDLVGPNEVMPLEQQVGLTDDPELRKLAPLYPGDTYRRHLEELIHRGGLDDRVTFHGAVGHAEGLADLYQRADVVVMPSIWDEPFGMPVVEAMSAGAPVITTRVGAFPELVNEPETGLTFERANPQSLTAAIERLIVDEPLRRQMSLAARQCALQRFSWDSLVDQLKGYYRDVLSSPPIGDGAPAPSAHH